MSFSVRIWAYLLIFTGSMFISNSLKIGAFNIQIFGKSKAAKPDVMKTIVDIVAMYDIILIQEIRDKSGNAINQLLETVNTLNTDNPFSMRISDRLGRTSSKEQYAFLYREESGLKIVNEYIYDDGDESMHTANSIVDSFEREPYIVHFQSLFTTVKQFAIIGIHIDPDVVSEELAALESVVEDVKNRLATDNVFIIGALNADCKFISKKKLAALSLRNNPNYVWLINDAVDTTVGKTDCAYDRIIVIGNDMINAVVPHSAQVVRFDEMYGLSSADALRVSDHYPVVVKLRDVDNRTHDVEELTTMGSALIAAVVVIVSVFYKCIGRNQGDN